MANRQRRRSSDARHTAPAAAKATRRQHYVPRFYLRRFADQKAQIGVLEVETGRRFSVGVANIALERDLYTVVGPDKQPSPVVEHLLSQLESLVAPTMEAICAGRLPPRGRQRTDMALFLALQMLRTPEFRDLFDEMGDAVAKLMLAFQSPEAIRRRLQESGRDASEEAVAQVLAKLRTPDSFRVSPTTGQRLRTVVEMILQGYAPLLLGRSWHLLKTAERAFITGDHPVVLARMRDGALAPLASGIALADWLYFPVDPYTTLGLHGNPRLRETVMPATASQIATINHCVFDLAYERVFYSPQSKDIVNNFKPRKKRTLWYINGKPVTPGKGWKTLIEEAQSEGNVLRFSGNEG